MSAQISPVSSHNEHVLVTWDTVECSTRVSESKAIGDLLVAFELFLYLKDSQMSEWIAIVKTTHSTDLMPTQIARTEWKCYGIFQDSFKLSNSRHFQQPADYHNSIFPKQNFIPRKLSVIFFLRIFWSSYRMYWTIPCSLHQTRLSLPADWYIKSMKYPPRAN